MKKKIVLNKGKMLMQEWWCVYAVDMIAGMRLSFSVGIGAYKVKYGNNQLYRGPSIDKAVEAFNTCEKVYHN